VNKSESIKNISVALIKFQAEVQNPKNTADNPFYKSKYAPLNEILNDVRPLLSKHGLGVIQSPSGDGEKITINTMLVHESGEWIEFDPLTLKAEKITPQGAGVAITYGRRYSFSSVTGIASEPDDDGNSLEGEQAQQQPKKLSEGQVSRLFAIAKKNQVSADAVKRVLMSDYKKTNVADLTKAEYDEMISRIENKEQKQGA
jgi:hypothetical protein